MKRSYVTRLGSLEVAFSQGHSWSHAISLPGHHWTSRSWDRELPEAEKCAPNISPSKRSDKSKWNLFFFFLLTFISKENSHPCQEERMVLCALITT